MREGFEQEVRPKALPQHLWLPNTPSARSQHRRGGNAVDDAVAELTSCTKSGTSGMRAHEQGPPPLPSSCTTGSCRGALVSMMQPADLRQFNHPAEFGFLRQPGFWRIARQ